MINQPKPYTPKDALKNFISQIDEIAREPASEMRYMNSALALLKDAEWSVDSASMCVESRKKDTAAIDEVFHTVNAAKQAVLRYIERKKYSCL